MASTSSGACCYYNSRCTLPSAWEPRVYGIRNQTAMQHLKVDGTRVRYVGPGADDLQAATIRSNYPLPPDCPLYYFEIKVLDKGQEGFIGVGFCTEVVQLGRLPGWDPHSYGYHGDDGHAFSGSGVGRAYGPPYTTGDVVGALYNKADRSISYFKNGEPLGVAFPDIQESSPLYPCVGLRTRGEEVVANFGTGAANESFRIDFTAIRLDFQRRVMDTVRKQTLPLLSSRGTALLPQLMYDYLLHQRYWRTAAVLGRDLLRSEGQLDEQALADITVRQQTYDRVASGRIDEALALLRDKYPPEVLSDRPSLDFRLRLQKFVEMVAAANAAAAAAPSAPSAAPPPASQLQQPQKQLHQQSPPKPAATTSDLKPTRDKGVAAAEPVPMEATTTSATSIGDEDEEMVTRGSSAAATAVVRTTGEPEAGTSEAEAAAPEPPPPPSSSPGPHEGLDDAAAAAAAVTGTEEEGAAEGSGCGAGAEGAVPTTRDILSYGALELGPRCRTSADRDLLTDALSLLAFDDPATCPAGYLVRPAHRIALAEELNGAMLACRGLPATSPLERLYQQAAAVMGELRRGDHPQILALPDLRSLLSVAESSTPPTGAGGGVLGGSAAGRGGAGGGDPVAL